MVYPDVGDVPNRGDVVVVDGDFLITTSGPIEGESDWNPWDDDCDIEDTEISKAVYHWKTLIPINGHTVTDTEMSLLVYQWKTGDVC